MSDQDVHERRRSSTDAAPFSTARTAYCKAAVALIAILIAQAAWILAVPPFRGNDEFDHAFRAAAVASGQWHLDQGTNDGRGLLAWVPRDLQRAASPQCASQKYTGPANCFPVARRGSEVQVATASGNYDPFFYWVIGTSGEPFRGDTSLYVMRMVTAMMTALLLALGMGLMTYAGAGRWATLGVLTAITPQVLYSGIVAAPNGPEMGFGFVLWSSLLALERRRGRNSERVLLGIATTAATPLAFVRFLGPLWVVSILLSVIALRGLPSTWDLVKRRRRSVLVAVVGVGTATCWWAAWMVISRQIHVPPGKPFASPVVGFDWVAAFDVPLWMLQAIAAFPYRDMPAPAPVYPLELLVIGYLVWAGWRRAGDIRRSRLLIGIVALALAVPILLSIRFMSLIGSGWQGRYELPFMIGILPLCGLMLDEAGFAPRLGHRPILIGSAICLTVSQVLCVVHLEQMELTRAVSVNDTGWVHPAPWVVGLIMLVACGVATLLRSDAHTPIRVPARHS